MNIYLIEQHRTGEILGVIDAEDEDAALDKYARRQGQRSFAEYRAATLVVQGELRVAPFEALG